MATQPTTTDSPGVINRLVRSLSSNHTVSSNGPSSSETSELPQSESSTAAAWRKKISVIHRFKDFGKNKKDKKIQFPPAVWFDNPDGTTAAAAIPLPEAEPGEPEGGPNDANGANDTNVHDKGIATPNTPPLDEPNAEDRPEPGYIARKIQMLMDSLPPLSGTPSGSRVVSQPHTPQIDEEGRPIPPPPPAQINDSKLVSLLSSASVMNGSIGRGTQSVWSVLEMLRAPKRPAQSGEGVPGEGGGSGENGCDDDDSSIMICSPLIPGADSKVLLADSEMVPVREENGSRQHSEEPQPGPSRSEEKPLPKRPLSGIWPWKVKEHRVWVPSSTNISVQVTWWGFRIYLPPPVLDVLNSKQLEAAKRAAMITTALKWLVDHIPIKLVPVQFRPVIPLLRQLTPYLGYIGVFIAWSWGAIKMYDKGHGVVLSATWILPVALIPSTWDADDFPPVTIHTGKTPAGDDRGSENHDDSGRAEDVPTEGNSDAAASPDGSRKGKERAR